MSLRPLRAAAICGIVALAIASAAIYWVKPWRGALSSAISSAPAIKPESTDASASSEDEVDPANSALGQAEQKDAGDSVINVKAETLQIGGILSGDGLLANRLLTASSIYGMHDYRVRRALMYARSLCKTPDPSGSLALPMPDPSRDWALESIADLCGGLGTLQIDESLPMVGEPESLHLIKRSLGRDAALAAAEGLLTHESDPVLIVEAALYAWENGRAPSPASMGVSPSSVSPMEQMAALSDAVQLAACYQPGVCGPESLQTLAFCARLGCAQGSNLREAMTTRHSDERMRLIEGYARWIRSFRRG